MPIVVLFTSSFLISGCTVTQSVYLQDVNVRGPVFQPPVLVTDSLKQDQFRLSPRITFSNKAVLDGRIDGHTMVNRSGEYKLDTMHNGNEVTFKEPSGENVMPFRGKNLRWTIPDVDFAITGEYTFGKQLAFTFGANYAAVGTDAFWGGNIGLGLCTEGKRMAFRFDGGLHWSTLSYDALTVVVTRIGGVFGSSEDIAVFHDRSRQTRLGFYISSTMNTKFRDWPLNLFASIALSKQRLTDYEPRESALAYPFYTSVYVSDARANASITFLTVTPGVYFSAGESQRVLAGVRWTNGTNLENGTIMFAPFIQWEVVF